MLPHAKGNTSTLSRLLDTVDTVEVPAWLDPQVARYTYQTEGSFLRLAAEGTIHCGRFVHGSKG